MILTRNFLSEKTSLKFKGQDVYIFKNKNNNLTGYYAVEKAEIDQVQKLKPAKEQQLINIYELILTNDTLQLKLGPEGNKVCLGTRSIVEMEPVEMDTYSNVIL
ncbi:MAG: hypothetical protein K0B15_08480 [Lentimicrobium sp.]|nr:hypothetical protein [Lentimicrobium sp.]